MKPSLLAEIKNCLCSFPSAAAGTLRRRWLLWLLALLVTALIIVPFDVDLQQAMSAFHIEGTILNEAGMKRFAHWGHIYGDFEYLHIGGTILILLVAYLRKSRYGRRLALCFAMSAITACIVGNSLKTLTGRPRPSKVLRIETDTKTKEVAHAFSFRGPTTKGGWRAYPSGHTMAAWAGLMVLGLGLRHGLWWAVPLAFLIGISRVVGDFHWPLDVTHGAIIGSLIAVIWARVLKMEPVERSGEDARSA